MQQADDDAARGTLILLRHGESTANAEGSFTGLRDVDLSERGVAQSHEAAALVAAEGLRPDVVFTSQMRRARRTAQLMLADLHDVEAPVLTSWRLNERDYGVLTGMPKRVVREQFGPERFHTWRRTLHGTPPPMPAADRAGVGFVEHGPGPHDGDHAADDVDSSPASAPGDGESLHDVVLRVRPLWTGPLLGRLRQGETVLVVAHGNSLRALCSIVDSLSDIELEELNLATAQPVVYEVGVDGRAAPRGGRFLDPDTAVLAAIRIAFEGGT